MLSRTSHVGKMFIKNKYNYLRHLIELYKIPSASDLSAIIRLTKLKERTRKNTDYRVSGKTRDGKKNTNNKWECS